MNIEIDRDTLLNPLSNVAGIVERNLVYQFYLISYWKVLKKI